MKFNNLRFQEKSAASGYDIIFDKPFRTLKNQILNNELCMELTLNFFNRNSENIDHFSDELIRVDDDIEEFSIVGCSQEDLEELFVTKKILMYVYGLNNNQFNSFRSDFTEHLGFTFLAVKCMHKYGYPKFYSKFYHEAYIYYKTKLLIEGESVVDSIHVNRKLKRLELCECKANVNTYLNFLSKNINPNGNPKIQSKIRNAHNKHNYMKNLKNMINTEFNNGFCDVIFLTYIWNTSEIRHYNRYKNDITFICGQDIKESFIFLKNMQIVRPYT